MCVRGKKIKTELSLRIFLKSDPIILTAPIPLPNIPLHFCRVMNGKGMRILLFTYFACFVIQVSSLYPTPCTVLIQRGDSGFFSSFARRLPMCVSTVRVVGNAA